jgi:hypothetical protein
MAGTDPSSKARNGYGIHGSGFESAMAMGSIVRLNMDFSQPEAIQDLRTT